MNFNLASIQKSKLIPVLGLAVLCVCFYVVLSTDVQENPGSTREGENPSLSDQNLGPNALTDAPPVGSGEADLLEKEYQTFNVPVLSLSSLGKILEEDPGLHLEIPDSARSLKLEALESGGRPLGEILIGLLSPHDLVFHRQGKLLRIIEGKYTRETHPGEGDKGAYRSCSLETAIRVKWAESVDLWIDSISPLKLRIDIQPVFDGSDLRWILLTTTGRQKQEILFRQALKASLGETSQIETQGDERFSLMLTPTQINETELILEVKFNHELSQVLP